MKYFLYTYLLFFPFLVNAKNAEKKAKRKITVFTSWGYNRAFFTKSAIHFSGDEYNFTLKHTQAKDRQSPFAFNTYFNPGTLSIPQYDFCIGVTLPRHINISIGQDHMKYVVKQYTQATIDGSIYNGTEFSGEYHNQHMQITPAFLQFEHTNGLNYVHLLVNKEKIWYEHHLKRVVLKTDAGINAGVLIPKSDVKLMHYPENDKFHLAGYGIGFNGGIKAELFRYINLRLDTKLGFINMPDILTRGIQYKDRAKQHFGFAEFFYSIGFQYPF